MFRDPCSPNAGHPLSRPRLDRMWGNLLAELEGRVEASGQRLKNGDKILFVEHRSYDSEKGGGTYRVPLYDLHSLRVTLITAYAERGVPISILSKFIAGHATIIMTLYYAKFGPAHISEIMNEASKVLADEEKRSYERFLAEATEKQILDVAALNDQVAVAMLKQANPGSWVADDRGICPTGCARCHEGGSLRQSANATNKEVFDPVPGGQNCTLCRFFISGPAFVMGLSAHFNEVGWKLKEMSAQYARTQRKLESLEAERYRCEVAGQVFLKGQQVEHVTKMLVREQEEVDVLGRTWHATIRLIDRCLATKGVQNDDDGIGRMNLVLSGTRDDLAAALTETTDFELADAVCHSAVVFEGTDAVMPTIRRAEMLDAMLMANHRRPIFVSHSDEEKLFIGNEMSKFLFARAGREDTLALMAGRETLERLELRHDGLGQDLEALIRTRLEPAVLRDMLPAPREDRFLLEADADV